MLVGGLAASYDLPSISPSEPATEKGAASPLSDSNVSRSRKPRNFKQFRRVTCAISGA